MQGYLYVDYPNKEKEDDMSADRYSHNVCAFEAHFEDIPNYSVNMEEGIIEAWVQVDSFEEEWIKYVYEDGKFKETERTRENTLMSN